jgi:hypothetical protein
MTTARNGLPDGIDRQHLHAKIGSVASWIRISIIGLLLLMGLAGWLGGGPTTERIVSNPKAEMRVHVPAPIRNGMLFEWRIAVTARAPIDDAVVAIPAALWRDTTINSLVPAASEEEHKDGEFRFHFGPLDPGETLLFKVDGQVNPPHFQRETGAIRLLDGERELARSLVDLKVVP